MAFRLGYALARTRRTPSLAGLCYELASSGRVRAALAVAGSAAHQNVWVVLVERQPLTRIRGEEVEVRPLRIGGLHDHHMLERPAQQLGHVRLVAEVDLAVGVLDVLHLG